jgi:hypothetical protein
LKVLYPNLSVANQPAQQAGLERPMIGNSERLLCRIYRMAQADMASALPYYLITKALEGSDSLLP